MSPRQVFNVLDCARSLYHWARQPGVNKLPITFITPFTKEIVGEKTQKDPLRRVLIPQQDRMALVGVMGAWELSQLALSLVLPPRPEDFSGLLVTDVDFAKGVLQFGTRLIVPSRQRCQCRNNSRVGHIRSRPRRLTWWSGWSISA